MELQRLVQCVQIKPFSITWPASKVLMVIVCVEFMFSCIFVLQFCAIKLVKMQNFSDLQIWN